MGGSTAARLHDGRARAGRRGATRLHSPPRGRVAFPNRTRHLLATQPPRCRIAARGARTIPTIGAADCAVIARGAGEHEKGRNETALTQDTERPEGLYSSGERYGAQPTDEVFYAKYDDDNTLVGATAIYWKDDDFEPPHFFTFEYWTPEELYGNAIHNDELGTEDDYRS